jgi:hypothetical protein
MTDQIYVIVPEPTDIQAVPPNLVFLSRPA